MKRFVQLTMLLVLLNVGFSQLGDFDQGELDEIVNRIVDEYHGENCPINSFDIPGEGVRLKGSTGGLLFTSELSAPLPPTHSEIMEDVMQVIDGNTGEEPSALLIVDDFGGSPSDALYLTTNLGAAVEYSTDTGISQRDRSEFMRNEFGLTHGSLVLFHTYGLLSEVAPAPVFRTDQIGNDDAFMIAFKFFDTLLFVVAVDTSGFNTREIVNAIEEAIDILTESDLVYGIFEEYGFDSTTIRRHVINMSFAVVPCALLRGYESSSYDSFLSYGADVLNARSVRQFLEALQLYYYQNPDTALNNFARRQDPTSDSATILVASAGNYELSYPMYPAAEAYIISSSAANDVQGNQSSYSNDGEIMTVGDVRLPDEDISLLGTSYSAPVLSVFTALHLTQEDYYPICSALQDFRHWPDPANRAQNPSPNYPLSNAVSRWCTSSSRFNPPSNATPPRSTTPPRTGPQSNPCRSRLGRPASC